MPKVLFDREYFLYSLDLSMIDPTSGQARGLELTN